MAFAIVHFTAGFVPVLAVLSAFPTTRHRLTGAFLGGILALGPDAHNLVGGPAGEALYELHAGPHADAFFLHRTLDGAAYRAHNVELTFLSLAVLGVAFLAYDRRFGAGAPPSRVVDAAEGSDEAS